MKLTLSIAKLRLLDHCADYDDATLRVDLLRTVADDGDQEPVVRMAALDIMGEVAFGLNPQTEAVILRGCAGA